MFQGDVILVAFHPPKYHHIYLLQICFCFNKNLYTNTRGMYLSFKLKKIWSFKLGGGGSRQKKNCVKNMSYTVFYGPNLTVNQTSDPQTAGAKRDADR